jgi:hypothetical protein
MEVAVSRHRQTRTNRRLPADPPPQCQGSPAFPGEGFEDSPGLAAASHQYKNPAYGEAIRELKRRELSEPN